MDIDIVPSMRILDCLEGSCGGSQPILTTGRSFGRLFVTLPISCCAIQRSIQRNMNHLSNWERPTTWIRNLE
jgi:hypothetical protein